MELFALRCFLRQLKEVNAVIRWQVRFHRVLIGLGAVVALAVSAGAGCRW
jgi:hypothetical protein